MGEVYPAGSTLQVGSSCQSPLVHGRGNTGGCKGHKHHMLRPALDKQQKTCISVNPYTQENRAVRVRKLWNDTLQWPLGTVPAHLHLHSHQPSSTARHGGNKIWHWIPGFVPYFFPLLIFLPKFAILKKRNKNDYLSWTLSFCSIWIQRKPKWQATERSNITKT